MLAAMFSVFLFGFVQPGSKFVLDTGISLLHFCLLYSGFRLLSQLPFVFMRRSYLIPSQRHLLLLGGMGLVGAALQLTEFKGISDGLPVSVVTFLLYSYPLWTVIFSSVINSEKFSFESIFKVALSVIGMIFLLGSQVVDFKFDPALIYPVAASILMALWISLSNLSKKKGCSSWSISLYYDLFSFLTLAGLVLSKGEGAQLADLQKWMLQDFHTPVIVCYAIFLGVVPNLLFYKASQNLTAMTASLILLFEPVISSVVSALAWNEAWNEILKKRFLLGAFCLLASNIPYKYLFASTFNFIKIKEDSI